MILFVVIVSAVLASGVTVSNCRAYPVFSDCDSQCTVQNEVDSATMQFTCNITEPESE